MMRRFGLVAAAIALLLPAATTAGPLFPGPGPGPGPVEPQTKVKLELLLLPNSVIVSSVRDMTLCLVNHGEDGQLLRGGDDDDRIMLNIPVGLVDADLLEATGALACSNAPAGWDCSIDTSSPTAAVVTLQPSGPSVNVASAQTACADLTGVEINPVEGAAFLSVNQQIPSSRASPPVKTLFTVFKSLDGVVNHDDLANVQNEQHHSRYTDAEATAAVGPHFGGDHADLAGVQPGQHHAPYTDTDAINAVGPHFGGDHADLAGVQPGQHHAPYTDADATAAVGPHYTDSQAIAAVGPETDTKISNHATDSNAHHVRGLANAFYASASVALPAGEFVERFFICLPGQEAIAGSYSVGSPGPGVPLESIEVRVFTNRQRLGNSNQWHYVAREYSGGGATFHMFITCVDP